MMLAVGLCACNGEGFRGDGFSGVLAEDYHGISEDAAWTWTDTPGEELADESLLLRGRVEDGEIRIRRGARYADGEDWGTVKLDVVEGLTLRSWELGGSSGQGPLLLCPAEVAADSRIEQGGWACDAAIWTPQDTFFGTFEQALVLTCEGDGPAGTWAFAEGVGLIHLATGDTELSLVAPW